MGNRIRLALAALALILGLAGAAQAGTPSVQAYTCILTTGFGCLQKTPVAELVNGDLALVVNTDIACVYRFDAGATDQTSADTTDCIANVRPADYSSQGVWKNVRIGGAALTSGRAANPALNFMDADTEDVKTNAKIAANCTTTSSTQENCDLDLQTMTGGTLTTKLHLGSDGTANFLGGNLITTGRMSGNPKIVSVSSSCTIGSNCDGTSVEVAAGGIVLATAAVTVTLPEIVASPSATQVGVGASLCLIARDASEALIVDPHANDSITLAGSKKAAGKYVTATGAGSKICLVAVEADNWMDLGTVGTWTAE